MYLVKMRPEEIKDAVNRGVPAIMAAGVVEYHGPHLPVGTDAIIASTIVEEVEKRCECVVLPHFPFGPTLSWAGSPEDGEIDFDPEALYVYAKEVFKNIMAIGFKRIYVLQHHQGSEGLQALTLRRAAAELLREKARSWKPGWGRGEEKELPPANFWRWITVAYIDTFSKYAEGEGPIPCGHAGKGETQLMMRCTPEAVKMTALETQDGHIPRWLKDAGDATPEEGAKWLEFCVQGWLKELRRSDLPK